MLNRWPSCEEKKDLLVFAKLQKLLGREGKSSVVKEGEKLDSDSHIGRGSVVAWFRVLAL